VFVDICELWGGEFKIVEIRVVGIGIMIIVMIL
jgi:hypothetical protein